MSAQYLDPRPRLVVSPLDRKVRYLAVIQVRNAGKGVQAEFIEVVQVSPALGAKEECD
jgi:hypothetical protein